MQHISDPKAAKAYFEAKTAFTTGPVELNAMLERGENMTIIDVRMPEDYAKGHIPGAVNLPKAGWGQLEGLDKEKINVLYCYSHVCHLAARAAAQFAGEGYPVMEMDGGFNAWKQHNLEITT